MRRACAAVAALIAAATGGCGSSPPRPAEAVPQRLQLAMDIPNFASADTTTAAASPLPSMLECLAEPTPAPPSASRFQLSRRMAFRAPEPSSRIVAPQQASQAKAVTRALAVQEQRRVHVSREQQADDLYLAAGEALLRGERRPAEVAYRRALELMPAHHDARVALGGLLIDEVRRDEAAAVIQPGLAQAPESPPLRMLQARLWLAEGAHLRALDLLLNNTPPLTAYPDYHALIAVLQQRTGRHEAAAAVFRQLVQRRPYEGAWWVGLGISEEALRHYDAARTAYRQATQAGRLAPALQSYAEGRLAELTR